MPASVAATRYRFSFVLCWVHATRRLLVVLDRWTAAVTGLVTTTVGTPRVVDDQIHPLVAGGINVVEDPGDLHPD